MIPLARRCAWCGLYPTFADQVAAEQGVPVSHSICGKCSVKFEAQLEANGARA